MRNSKVGLKHLQLRGNTYYIHYELPVKFKDTRKALGLPVIYSKTLGTQ